MGNRDQEGPQRGFQGRGYEGYRGQQGSDDRWNQQGYQGRGYQQGSDDRDRWNQGYQGRGYQQGSDDRWNQGYQGRGQQGSDDRYSQSFQGRGQERGYGNQGFYQERGVQDNRYGGQGGYGNRDWGNQGDFGSQGRGMGGSWESRGGEPRFGGSGEMNYGNQGMGTKGRAPRGYKRSDERIQDDICDRLMQHGRIDASDVEVKVSNGEVTLTGTVESRAMKHQVEDLVDAISGVDEIHNQLRIKRAEQTQTKSMGEDKPSMTAGKSGTGQTSKNANESKREHERHAS